MSVCSDECIDVDPLKTFSGTEQHLFILNFVKPAFIVHLRGIERRSGGQIQLKQYRENNRNSGDALFLRLYLSGFHTIWYLADSAQDTNK
ncbi:hypothetical protein BA744_28070 [Vibrio parahaemolyticus]|nr:hypothetical protein BA744_28070 [Vibrio parahaemolyticus]